ncbi:MAG TPA: AAA family ATPase [Candidatus Saccharimonadales bacterium]|nr:AAA family ATPase [Candidatus Saccharimonadales bacterium]
MKQQLIIVHGIPGSGKTTLSRKLAHDLQLPLIGKDDIKELYFEKLGIGDREWSRSLGRASVNALFVLIDELLATSKQFIAENAYYKEFAVPEIRAALAKYNATCLELYCHADPAVRTKRFIDRNEQGERHPGHVDHQNYDPADNAVLEERYAPLGIGEVIMVDTTLFGDAEYQALLDKLRQQVVAS